MKENIIRENAENLALAIDKSIHDIYMEHPHECNIVFYIGGIILLSIGAWFEYEKICKC